MAKHVLFVLTNPRIGEKIWPVIKGLYLQGIQSTCYCIGEMSTKTPWYGEVDQRLLFYERYHGYSTIIWGPGKKEWGDNITDEVQNFTLDKYDAVVLDDNLNNPSLGTEKLLSRAGVEGKVRIGCPHGNQILGHIHTLNLAHVLDIGFVLGNREISYYTSFRTDIKLVAGGYPSSDCMDRYIATEGSYILLVPNFLGFRKSGLAGAKLTFNKTLLEDINLVAIQEAYNIPIVVKLKARFDESTHHGHDYQDSQEYVRKAMPEGLDFRVVTDNDNLENLVGNAKVVVSCPSTLCFKSLLARKPTVVIKGTGTLGLMDTYSGVAEPNASSVRETLEKPLDFKWLRENLANHFCSTEQYVKEIGNHL